jgi:hypothetical protein
MTARNYLTKEQRRRLARLSPETRWAIKQAFVEWVETAKAEGYGPISDKPTLSMGDFGSKQPGWYNFLAEGSSFWLCLTVFSQGRNRLPERPPTRHSYPDYDAESRS